MYWNWNLFKNDFQLRKTQCGKFENEPGLTQDYLLTILWFSGGLDYFF